jgi:hypothetical protein
MTYAGRETSERWKVSSVRPCRQEVRLLLPVRQAPRAAESRARNTAGTDDPSPKSPEPNITEKS